MGSILPAAPRGRPGVPRPRREAKASAAVPGGAGGSRASWPQRPAATRPATADMPPSGANPAPSTCRGPADRRSEDDPETIEGAELSACSTQNESVNLLGHEARVHDLSGDDKAVNEHGVTHLDTFGELTEALVVEIGRFVSQKSGVDDRRLETGETKRREDAGDTPSDSPDLISWLGDGNNRRIRSQEMGERDLEWR